MTTPCHIMDDGTGEKFIMPGCGGTMHKHADTAIELQQLIDEYCHCDRRPIYQPGDEAKIARLEYQKRKLQARLDAIHARAHRLRLISG